MDKGIFAVYKPRGMKSHDVVSKVRKITNVKRVGHGGTLDPLAEGVLVIAVGRENTKLLDQYVKGDKEYIATLKLGFESVTDDSEGPIYAYKSKIPQNPRTNEDQPQLGTESGGIGNKPTHAEITQVLKGFIGKIEQTPPIYSAIKIKGKPAYKYARQGVPLPTEIKRRMVEIMNIKILRYEYPELELKISCGTGTYIRTLGKDIGGKLETGAYLIKLVRTRVDEFTMENSVSLEKLVEIKTVIASEQSERGDLS